MPWRLSVQVKEFLGGRAGGSSGMISRSIENNRGYVSTAKLEEKRRLGLTLPGTFRILAAVRWGG